MSAAKKTDRSAPKKDGDPAPKKIRADVGFVSTPEITKTFAMATPPTNERQLVNATMAERKKMLAHLKVERETNDDLRKALHQKETDLTHLRRVVIEHCGGLEFPTTNKEGRPVVVVKEMIGGEQKHEVIVDTLTAILQSKGVLGEVIRDLREMEDPTAASFDGPPLKKGTSATTTNPSLLSQLQLQVDAGMFQRKSEELQERERSIRLREKALDEREKELENRYQAIRRMATDPYLRLIEEEKRRIKELYDESWLRGVENEMKEVERELAQNSEEGDDGSAGSASSFDGIELCADANDVEALEKGSSDESERASSPEVQPDQPTEGEEGSETEEVAALLVELDLLQAKQACSSNLAEFVKPYVERCVQLKRKGQPFMSFPNFCHDDLVCTHCFHHDKTTTTKHLPPACKLLCCGIKRCDHCLHVHEGSCKCEHGANFLHLVRERMK